MAIEFDANSAETPSKDTVIEVGEKEALQLKDEWTTESDDTITQEESLTDPDQLQYERYDFHFEYLGGNRSHSSCSIMIGN